MQFLGMTNTLVEKSVCQIGQTVEAWLARLFILSLGLNTGLISSLEQSGGCV